MKQETKQRLRYYSKIGQYIVLTLCWLMALIGISAYSVYWLRQNVSYVQETTKRDLKPRNLEAGDDYKYFVSNQTKITSCIDYSNNQYNIRDYISFAQSQEDYSQTYRYVLEGDFSFKSEDTIYTYNQMSFLFNYDVGGSGYSVFLSQLVLLQVIEGQGSIRQLSILYNGDYTDRVISCDFDKLVARSYGNINEVYHASIIYFYFEVALNMNSAYSYTFQSGSRNLPQYLNSYNRLQYGQIVYSQNDTNLDALTIPMVFVSNGRLYDNITILMRPCWYYYNSAGQLIDNWAITPTGTNVPYVCTHVLFGYYGKTLDWTWDTNQTGVISSVSNGSIAMFLGYNGFSFQDDTNPSFWAPNYLCVQGLQVNRDYQDILISNVDDIPFSNTSGNNLKPYNNISIRNILETYFNFYGDVGGSIAGYYDVGVGNVFTMISTAFQSLIPLFAIQIIPGITLGLLVMLPLVVTIILVILRLVKK